jgi:hypothetical protein
LQRMPRFQRFFHRVYARQFVHRLDSLPSQFAACKVAANRIRSFSSKLAHWFDAVACALTLRRHFHAQI